MTWFVSPEEWLLDFTVIPRGRPRGGESLDVVDDRLRAMLAPPTTAAGIVIPAITATRRSSGAVSAVSPPRSESGPRPVAAAIVAPPEPPKQGLSVELHPTTDDDGPIPPPPPSGAMVIPTLTRFGHPLDGEHPDTDDADVLERLSPIGGSDEPGIGIPRDDDSDALFSAVASSAMLIEAPPPEPEPEPEPEPAAAEIAPVAEPVAEAEPHHDADEIEADALEEPEEEVEAPAAKPAEKPGAPAAPPRPPAPAPPPVVAPTAVPRPPPAPPTAAGPPRPPPTPEKPAADKAGPPRPPPAVKAPAPPPAVGKTEPPGAKKKRSWADEVFADYYGSITPIDADASAELDVAFIKTCLELTSGQTLLDVACGDGRHAISFAAHGLDVTGLDCSMQQLMRAARRNESGRFSFDILHGDMRAIPRDRTFDVVTCLGSSIGYFEAEETNRQCLQDMVESLKPGGKLALHVFNRDYLMSVLPCRSWWQGRGCLVLDVADMHFFSNRIRIHRTVVFEDGRQFEHHISIRAYSVSELGKILTQAGARVLEVSGGRDTRGRFYGASSPDIWLFAQRRDDV